MDCTGKERRSWIYKNYNISVVGCIKLYGNDYVTSDANKRKITDKYYDFVCTPKNKSVSPGMIKCGYNTAKEICEACHLDMPKLFNPFATDSENDRTESRNNTNNNISWNIARLQLYNAIMLFITRYHKKIEPNTKITYTRDAVLKHPDWQIQEWMITKTAEVFHGFNTNISKIIGELSKYGKIRNTLHFDELRDYLRQNEIDTDIFD